MDKHFGTPHQLFPLEPENSKVRYFLKRFEDVPIQALTFGVSIIHREKVTDFLRYPFSEPTFLEVFTSFLHNWTKKLSDKSQEHQGTPCGDILHEKALKAAEVSLLMADFDSFKKILETLESILDEVENYLGSPDRIGSWLCGSTFTAADICFVR